MTDDRDWPCCATPITAGSGADEIRAALLPKYRDRFDTELTAMLKPWWLKARLQQNPEAFRRLTRRGVELLTGEPCPEDEPLAATREKAGSEVVAVGLSAENVGVVGYRGYMIAEPLGPNDVPEVPSFPPGTTPAAIHDALIDEERADFQRAYEKAMATATRTMDLTPLLDVLRTYHRIAVVTQRQGAAAHRRMLDQIAHAFETGEAPAGSVSDEEMMARINARLAQ